MTITHRGSYGLDWLKPRPRRQGWLARKIACWRRRLGW